MRWFTEHPATVGETYAQHFHHAGGFGITMVLGGLACLVHAVLPFAFTKIGSAIIERLHDRMVVNRHELSEPSGTAASSVPVVR